MAQVSVTSPSFMSWQTVFTHNKLCGSSGFPSFSLKMWYFVWNVALKRRTSAAQLKTLGLSFSSGGLTERNKLHHLLCSSLLIQLFTKCARQPRKDACERVDAALRSLQLWSQRGRQKHTKQTHTRPNEVIIAGCRPWSALLLFICPAVLNERASVSS